MSDEYVFLEIIDKITGEVFELEPLPYPTSPRSAGKLVKALREHGCYDADDSVMDLPHMPEHLVDGPVIGLTRARVNSDAYHQVQQQRGKAYRRYEKQHGAIPFGYWQNHFPDIRHKGEIVSNQDLRDLLAHHNIPWRDLDQIHKLLVTYDLIGTKAGPKP